MKNIKIGNNITLSENADYLLNNVTNYKPKITNSLQDILTKFVSITTDYMAFISEKINMKNKSHYEFIVERGLVTVTHVFVIIFYFTKNLDLAYYHSQKAYYFFIEFVEQISDDNVTFLQLTSRDATLFVYKRTIYELNNEYIKHITEPSTEDKKILSMMDSHISIYKNIIEFLMKHNELKLDNRKEFITVICNNIKNVSEWLHKCKATSVYIELLNPFINLLTTKEIDITLFFKLIEEFIKKIHKTNHTNNNNSSNNNSTNNNSSNNNSTTSEKQIKNNLKSLEVTNFIQTENYDKIIEFIFAETN